MTPSSEKPNGPRRGTSNHGGAARFTALASLAIIAILIALAGIVKLRPAWFREHGAGGTDPLAPDLNMDMLSFPPFTLTNQDGATLTREDLIGGITIVDFFFSNCPFICPALSQNMKRAQDELAGANVRFLSISVDPEHDTPARLREYAREVGADTSRWTFATGPRAEVTTILTGGLLLAAPIEEARTAIALAGGGAMSNITHPSHFIFVGPDGDVIALYSGLDPDQVSLLIERARAASQRLAAGR